MPRCDGKYSDDLEGGACAPSAGADDELIPGRHGVQRGRCRPRPARPQRGIVRSAGPVTGVTPGHLADDVAGVIGKLGIGPAIVLGHAFGNFVGRALATDYRGAISALVLAAASGKNIPPEIDSAPFRAGDLTLPED
jgi:pimeloyl-ACP methyl ester carboxylesterase